ncbi:hypothetical protein BB560_006281 [Smittium megazygosporum]|uniref:tRNA-dihydrouridine(16/17) synthase [NAD(P)(+)] n=1 Tax=Smittium megazygosporum TaxID=133381 RepID=A0A2T9YBE7_9FUNG|nr:hypothetical protein BB560_006281 [Smittium megazygosporum]
MPEKRPLQTSQSDTENDSFSNSKYFLAPMAWRILARRYGAQVCFTPMFHAKMFSDKSNRAYFNDMWQTNEHDRPLIVQFCANDPDSFLQAALLVQDSADAVDLNLGCPQHIARRGKYGAYLMDEWVLISKIIETASKNLKIPVTAKIRVYPEIEKTIAYAQMLVKAGAKMLTVHGRLKDQKGHKTGLCDWTKIKAVRDSVDVPVVANGGILYFEDVEYCLKETGANGVMIAESHLYNPTFFNNDVSKTYEVALEYLEICKSVPTKPAYVRAHLFKIFRPCLSTYTEQRSKLASAVTLEEFTSVVLELKAELQKEESNSSFDHNDIQFDSYGYKMLPNWVCQPLVRTQFDPKTSVSKIPLGRTIPPK